MQLAPNFFDLVEKLPTGFGAWPRAHPMVWAALHHQGKVIEYLAEKEMVRTSACFGGR